MEQITFGPFRLDPAERLLTYAGNVSALRPKTLEVLLLLLRRRGEVVSKREILDAVWGGTVVTEYVLTTCISEIRAALGDDAKQPRYLKTVHRGGYQLNVDEPKDARAAAEAGAEAIVGREAELAKLNAALARAITGKRQIVFLTGEMGIGKTTLAHEFIKGPAVSGTTSTYLVGVGQCIEQFGVGEPYMPVFEAIGRLGRETQPARVIDVLRRAAPTWLAQIPGLLPAEQRAELRRELPGETQEHMLRIIADGIEALSERQLLILLLEDLHLSDAATLELIAALALRRGPAHLLILGTYRSAEDYPASAKFQGLKQQLLLHRQCEEIALAPLTPTAVGAYLAKRFSGLKLPPGLAATVHDRTEGNALFVARLLDQLLEDGILRIDPAVAELQLDATRISRHVPGNLRAMVEQRADSLAGDDREVLEAASVAGVNFWSAIVAAALDWTAERVERVCSQLVRHHGFLALRQDVEGGKSDLGARYAFSHALYHQVLYERIEASRRQRLHRSIGDALRRSCGDGAMEIAAELASHFERGGDVASAVEFYDKAAAAAAAQGANREAVGYLDRALRLLAPVDPDPATAERKLELLIARGQSLLASAGYASVEVLDNYQLALELARRLGNPFRQMSSLLALSTCQQTRANLAVAEALALELIRVAERSSLPPPFIAQMKNPLSQARMYQGAVTEALELSRAAISGLRELPIPLTPPDSRPALWAEPSIMLYCQYGAVSVAAGKLGQAAAAVEEALRIARELRHPFNLAYALSWAGLYEDTLGHWDAAISLSREAIETAQSYDFPFWGGIASVLCGHATARRGDIAEGLPLMRRGIELWSSTGAKLTTSLISNLLAEVCLTAGDVVGAQAALRDSETHAKQSGEVVFLAETYRLRAECKRRSGVSADAVETVLRSAISTARQQGTRLWELRAALDLYRLSQGAESRAALGSACQAFDDEPEITEIAEARSIVRAKPRRAASKR